MKVHQHTTSHEQWETQVKDITDNLESMAVELRTYERLYNATMKRIIRRNISDRMTQLKVKLQEVPKKDRPQDIANNKWCRECLQ